MFKITEIILSFLSSSYSSLKKNILSVISIVLILSFLYELLSEKSKIEKLEIENNNLRTQIQMLKNKIQNIEFESKQIYSKKLLENKIHNIDLKNNIITEDKNKSTVSIKTKKDIEKINNLDSNKTYILEIK